jgi:CheY-like chemotaxis protein
MIWPHGRGVPRLPSLDGSQTSAALTSIQDSDTRVWARVADHVGEGADRDGRSCCPHSPRHDPVTTAATRTRVLLVDDHEFFRASLSLLLAESGTIDVLQSCASVADAVNALNAGLHPDVVLMDLDMPDVDGVQGAALLQQRWPDLPVLILTGTAPGPRWQAALDAGAREVLTKTTAAEQLVQTIVHTHTARRQPPGTEPA